MAITLETAFQRARARMRRRSSIYDPGILVRIEFDFCTLSIAKVDGVPLDNPSLQSIGPNADDGRTLWEFWPVDRQTHWFDQSLPPDAKDMLVSGLRSARTGLQRDNAFLGQFQIVERPGEPFLFVPTRETLSAFATPLGRDAQGKYVIDRAVTMQEAKAAWPPVGDLKNLPVRHHGHLGLRFSVLGVSYVA